MNSDKSASGKERYRLLCLAKAAGFTVKQAAPLCGATPLRVSKIWKDIQIATYSTTTRDAYLSIDDKHLVITLLLIGFDIFDVARTIGRQPIDILSFIESEVKEWWWIWCQVCTQRCITFDLKVRHCRKPSCVKMARNIRTRETEFDSKSRPKIGKSPLTHPLKFTDQNFSNDTKTQRKSRSGREKYLHANA